MCILHALMLFSLILTLLQKSSANQMLGMLRYFEQNLSPENSHEEEKAALSWGTVSMEDVAKKFLALCSRVQDILAQEERLVHLEPPVYVLGM